MFKTNSLSNKDIYKILKSQGIQLNGIYMKDELPNKLNSGFYVINLQSSNDGDGTHWTALYYQPKQSYYFDAYGFLAPIEVEEKLKSYIYNNKQIQNYNSTACGYYCISFILSMNKQKNKEIGFKKFIDVFSNNSKKNDEILYNYLYN